MSRHTSPGTKFTETNSLVDINCGSYSYVRALYLIVCYIKVDELTHYILQVVNSNVCCSESKERGGGTENNHKQTNWTK